jgi:hypothetical protein
MKTIFAGLLLIAAFAVSGCAPMGMSASLQVRSAPPPPAFEFKSEPRFNYLSDLRISVIADDSFGYDMFSSGGSFYVYSGGYWYRSQSARGPFVAVEARRVPRQIFNVDDNQYRWRSHPEGWRPGQHKGDKNHMHGGDSGGPNH